MAHTFVGGSLKSDVPSESTPSDIPAEDKDGDVDHPVVDCGPGTCRVGYADCDNPIAELKSEHQKDEIFFETFYHRNGQEFQCMYRSGMRYYYDHLGSKEWLPFPMSWYTEGWMVTNTILKDDGSPAISRGAKIEQTSFVGETAYHEKAYEQ